MLDKRVQEYLPEHEERWPKATLLSVFGFIESRAPNSDNVAEFPAMIYPTTTWKRHLQTTHTVRLLWMAMTNIKFGAMKRNFREELINSISNIAGWDGAGGHSIEY